MTAWLFFRWMSEAAPPGGCGSVRGECRQAGGAESAPGGARDGRQCLAQHVARVDLGAAALHFEVQVRAGDLAGGAAQADLLVGPDLLAGTHAAFVQVGVQGAQAIGMLDDDDLAVLGPARIRISGYGDLAIGRRDDSSAAR